MFRWLSRYVRQINILGVGIELRAIPEAEAKPLLASALTQASAQERAGPTQALPAVVQRQDYICVSGTSASAQRTPREIDLMADGEEIQLHVHQPGGTQPRMWVGRQVLQESLDRWKGTGGSAEPITVPARTARKEAQVVFVVDDDQEVEVQAGWWIWVSRQDLKAALEGLGLRIPW